MISFEAASAASFQTPRCGPGRYRCSGVPSRRFGVILRPYISDHLAVEIEDRDHQRAVEVLVPALAEEAELLQAARAARRRPAVLAGSR